MKTKTKYNITYHGPTGKIETVEIEATSIAILDGADGSLVCWIKSRRAVLALPYRSLILTRIVSTPNLTKV